MDIKIDASMPWGSLVDETRRVLVLWFAIITKGHRALTGLDFQNDTTLFFSLRFMIYMGLICFALQFPLLSVFGDKQDNIVFIMASLLFLYVTWFSYATIIHLSIKVFGGKGVFKATFAAFCFLSAFMPIGLFIFLVPEWYYLKTIDRVPFIIGPNDSVFRYLAPNEKIPVLIFFFLGLTLLIYSFVHYYKSLRIIHKISNLKGFISFSSSIMLIILFALYVERPLDEVLKRLAFK